MRILRLGAQLGHFLSRRRRAVDVISHPFFVQVAVMSLWRRRPGLEENYGISAGQRFLSVGRARSMWEVITVARHPGDFVPHVRLCRVGSEHDGKTVALDVLRDRRFYEPAT